MHVYAPRTQGAPCSGRWPEGLRTPMMARIHELRLMTKVARLYDVQKLRQADICTQLAMHQSTVSRLLKRAEREGIVRVTVTPPSGTHTEIEDAVQARYRLGSAIVVDSTGDEHQVALDLGAAAAYYLETTLQPADVIGISAWSAALLAHGGRHAREPPVPGCRRRADPRRRRQPQRRGARHATDTPARADRRRRPRRSCRHPASPARPRPAAS